MEPVTVTSDFPDTSKMRQGNGGAAHPGDLDTDARAAALTAPNMAKFAKALGIPHQQAMAINERLKLGVPILRADRKESGWERKSLPKPQAKQKGGGK